jgi:HD-GYP domain-containing protein (c-di-GMP phosphodiesterase class II)
LSHEAAITTLRRESTGGKWDPIMVEQFASMLGEEAPSWEAISQPAPMLRLA